MEEWSYRALKQQNYIRRCREIEKEDQARIPVQLTNSLSSRFLKTKEKTLKKTNNMAKELIPGETLNGVVYRPKEEIDRHNHAHIMPISKKMVVSKTEMAVQVFFEKEKKTIWIPKSFFFEYKIADWILRKNNITSMYYRQ